MRESSEFVNNAFYEKLCIDFKYFFTKMNLHFDSIFPQNFLKNPHSRDFFLLYK